MAKSLGFTLIELLIALTIVAILATIAYPNFAGYLLKSKRIEAIQGLHSMQLQQEEWRISHPAYASNDDAAHFLPSHPHYEFKVKAASDTDYVLEANAKNGSAQQQDKAGNTACHTLTLNRNSTKTPAACWQ
ncbi:type IV pilin [Oceanisphaera marina]|uniref:Type IV pilin n=1 Tax=Oceanisphaera marina TaxID=2017550 RepID=A0ABQ1IE18_9GAMM|nr:type IV pilin protein [Oceanisphaera marina]GGB36026.1 type IV pilin [Oceanisphaera marina]